MLYNSDLKESFIELHHKSSQVLIRKHFSITYRKEKKAGKDLAYFTMEEMEDTIHSFKLNSLNSVKSYVYTIKRYLSFCVEMGKIKENILEEVYSRKWLEQFVLPVLYITKEELYRIVESCKNPQDAVIPLLIFEGVLGKGKSEIINLKIDDIRINENILMLRDKDNKIRRLSVSEKCIETVLKAYHQETYMKIDLNGKKDRHKLKQSPYILKNFGKKSRDGEKVSYAIIHERLNKLSKVFPQLPTEPRLIEYSGMASLAKDIYVQSGIVNEKERNKALNEISNRFQVKKQLQSNGKLYPAHHLKQYVDYELINEIYGLNLSEEIAPFKLVDISFKKKRHEISAVDRDGQEKFREDILWNYEEKCCITNEETRAVLEAAHIQEYISADSNHPQNGIPLRIDFHRLFDRGLLSISEDYTVMISYK